MTETLLLYDTTEAGRVACLKSTDGIISHRISPWSMECRVGPSCDVESSTTDATNGYEVRIHRRASSDVKGFTQEFPELKY